MRAKLKISSLLVVLSLGLHIQASAEELQLDGVGLYLLACLQSNVACLENKFAEFFQVYHDASDEFQKRRAQSQNVAPKLERLKAQISTSSRFRSAVLIGESGQGELLGKYDFAKKGFPLRNGPGKFYLHASPNYYYGGDGFFLDRGFIEGDFRTSQLGGKIYSVVLKNAAHRKEMTISVTNLPAFVAVEEALAEKVVVALKNSGRRVSAELVYTLDQVLHEGSAEHPIDNVRLKVERFVLFVEERTPLKDKGGGHTFKKVLTFYNQDVLAAAATLEASADQRGADDSALFVSADGSHLDMEAIVRQQDKFFGQGDYARMISLYRKALRVEPNNSIVLYWLAYTLLERGDQRDVPEAIDALKKALVNSESAAASAQYHGLLGLALLAPATMARANDEFQAALAINPRQGDALLGQGIMKLLQKDVDGAIESMKASLRDADNGRTHYWLGEAFKAKANLKAAKKQFKSACKANFPRGCDALDAMGK